MPQTPDQVAVYQAEPYVVAADVYGAPPHVGRGGWTWYTGSSGWMYRVAVESILGLRTEGGDTLVLEPCIPDQWPGFEMTWKLPGGDTTYRIVVSNPDSCSASIVRALVDGHDGGRRTARLADSPAHRRREPSGRFDLGRGTQGRSPILTRNQTSFRFPEDFLWGAATWPTRSKVAPGRRGRPQQLAPLFPSPGQHPQRRNRRHGLRSLPPLAEDVSLMRDARPAGLPVQPFLEPDSPRREPAR